MNDARVGAQQIRREIIDMQALHHDDQDPFGRVAPAIGDGARVKIFELAAFRFRRSKARLHRIVDDDEVIAMAGDAALDGERVDFAACLRLEQGFRCPSPP